MVEISTDFIDGKWYAVASSSQKLVATAVATSRGGLIAEIMRYVPADCERRIGDDLTPFVRRTMAMLVAIEGGDESSKEFELSEADLPPYLRAILTAAACIPMGYVTTYGSIAQVSGSPARLVGHTMATNPLYPLVPCHRVVGSDLGLVGYGGRQDESALRAKLQRLEAEALGKRATQLPVAGHTLALFPVEAVILKARLTLRAQGEQMELFGG